MLRSSNKITLFIQPNPVKRLTLNRKNLLIRIAFTTVNNTKHFIYFCMPIIDQFCAFYNDLKSSQLTDIKVIYGDDIELIDPIGEHRGQDQLTAYFDKLLQGAKHCDFSITSVAEHKLINPSDISQYSVNWVMSFATPKLNGGRTIDVDGMTLLKVRDDKIFYHRDYYDLGQMVYEHIPILGAITKKIKYGMRA